VSPPDADSTVIQENQLPGALRHRHETTSGTPNGRPRVRYRTTDNIRHRSFTLAAGDGDLDPSPRVAVFVTDCKLAVRALHV